MEGTVEPYAREGRAGRVPPGLPPVTPLASRPDRVTVVEIPALEARENQTRRTPYPHEIPPQSRGKGTAESSGHEKAPLSGRLVL